MHNPKMVAAGIRMQFHNCQPMRILRVVILHVGAVAVLFSDLSGCGKPQKQEAENALPTRPKAKRPAGRVLTKEEGEMWRAVERGDTAAVSEMLKTNPELAKWKDPMGGNFLRIAIQSSAAGEDMIRLLVEKGSDVNASDTLGLTPLEDAVVRKGHKIVLILLDAGADVTHRDQDGLSPLDVALRFEQAESAELLLAHGAEMDVFDAAMRCASSHTLLVLRRTGNNTLSRARAIGVQSARVL